MSLKMFNIIENYLRDRKIRYNQMNTSDIRYLVETGVKVGISKEQVKNEILNWFAFDKKDFSNDINKIINNDHTIKAKKKLRNNLKLFKEANEISDKYMSTDLDYVIEVIDNDFPNWKNIEEEELQIKVTEELLGFVKWNSYLNQDESTATYEEWERYVSEDLGIDDIDERYNMVDRLRGKTQRRLDKFAKKIEKMMNE